VGLAKPKPLGAGVLVSLGLLSAFGSALLGAGGAFFLVPALLMFGQPTILAVGLGQAIQLPISVMASFANLLQGQIDLVQGTLLAVILGGGVLLGVPLAHALSQQALRRLLGITMLLAGVAMGLRIGLSML
jgi:hypothetical protein